MQQLELFPEPFSSVSASTGGKVINQINPADSPFHSWYRLVLSFPPHLVRHYISRFEVQPGQTLLDPFCGTGTTLVEAQLQGISGCGIEANPMAHFASQVKTSWHLNPHQLIQHAEEIAEIVSACSEFHQPAAVRSLPAETDKLLLKNSISPLPLHKALMLLEHIDASQDSRFRQHERLALAQATVLHCSNLRFMPEVGIRRQKRTDVPLLEHWLATVRKMAADLMQSQIHTQSNLTPSRIYRADARQLGSIISPASLDGVFTSPPYPNEKDYTRATRLETVLLGFIHNRADLRALKQNLLRSNSRGVYSQDDDDAWIAQYPDIQTIAAEIEQRRLDLGKTSGFARLYGRVTKLYFGGMARHLACLRNYLKPGAQLGYVVGDQASYLQVLIRTGQLLARIADSLGYEVVDIDLFRTRLASVTQQQMREEVLILRWPGH